MPVSKSKPATIEAYIASCPVDIQDRLHQILATVRKAAPNATESLKWSMPAHSLQKILVTYKAFRNHIGFYPMPSAVKAFSKELKHFKTATGSIQLPHDKPLPIALLKKIVKFRVKEDKEGSIRWRTSRS